MKYTLEEVLKFSISIDRETGTKVCTSCKRRLPWTEFYVRPGGRIDPYTGERRLKVESKCMDCKREYNRQNVYTHRHKIKEESILVPVDLELAMSFPLQNQWRGNNGNNNSAAVQSYI